MFQRILNAIRLAKGSSLARSFSRVGWAGFWLQILLGSLPVLLTVYYFVFSRTGTGVRGGLPFVEYLTIIDLLILLFTVYWSFRYTRVGRKLLEPQHKPSEATVLNTIWIGVTASTVGMLFSMIVLLIEVANMLFFFLRAPQGGIPVIQTSGDAPYFVSSVDMVSLMALVLTLLAELIVLVLSLWLLFRTTFGSPEAPQGAGHDGVPGAVAGSAGGAERR
jgi:hypothetical protein